MIYANDCAVYFCQMLIYIILIREYLKVYSTCSLDNKHMCNYKLKVQLRDSMQHFATY